MESIFGLSDKVSREELMIVEVVDWVKLLRWHILLNSPILESGHHDIFNLKDSLNHLPDNFHFTSSG